MTSPRTLPELLLQVAARGDAPFLHHRGSSWTAAGFAAHVVSLAAHLRAHGAGRGDRVAFWLEKGLDDTAAPFAAALLGALAVPVNPRLKAAQVRHVVDDSDAALCVTAGSKLPAAGEPAAAFGARRWTTVEEVAPGQHLEPSPVAAADPAVLLYTSGSTGRPKGIVQSQRSLCVGARIVAGDDYLGLRGDDHLLAVLPSSFDYGLNQALCAAVAGCELTVHSYFTAADLVKRTAACAATALAGVPELWLGFVDAVQRGAVAPGELRALRLVTNSGGRLPARVAAFFLDEMPWVEVFSMYGLTEAFRSSFVPPGELGRRLDTVGKAMPGVELLVVDPDDGTLCAPGEVGELVHCGACVADGYWRDAEATAQRFRPHPVRGTAGGRCVYTGDLAAMDADGYVTLVGRRDAQLKVQGYRVAADEVVEVVTTVPGVATAAATTVCRGDDGIPVLAVAVVPRRTGEDAAALGAALVAACRQALPAYMVPGEVHCLTELPLNANHKLDHTALRASLTERDPDHLP